MRDRDQLIDRIRRNCDISDARHAGLFSICGLALRLRDLFKWERGLAVWEEGDPSEVLAWIGAREDRWEMLAGADYENLLLAGNEIDPFDTEAANRFLEPHGLYYGAGYARALKPTFFLAVVESRLKVDGLSVFRLGRELARDLLTLPALSQENHILLRQDAARLFLWDQIAYIPPSGRRAMAAALDACGVRDHRLSHVRHHLEELLRVQEVIHLHHELGEARDQVFDRRLWREIIAAFPHTRLELISRRVKDLLADTGPFGTLRHLCRERHIAGLAMFTAFQDRLSGTLFPQLPAALEHLLRTGTWTEIEEAVDTGHAAAVRCAETIAGVYRTAAARGDLSRVEADVDRALNLPS